MTGHLLGPFGTDTCFTAYGENDWLTKILLLAGFCFFRTVLGA